MRNASDETTHCYRWGSPIADTLKPLPVYDESLWDVYRGKVPSYAIERGITVKTCKEWGLGYDKLGKRLVIPVRDDGKLFGVVGRTICGHIAKYSNYSYDTVNDCFRPFPDKVRPLDFVPLAKERVVVGGHVISKSKGDILCVVEGPLDAVMVWQHGYNAISILGSWASAEQLKWLSKKADDGYEIVVLMAGVS